MPNRLIDIPDGQTMVVSDLHGDLDAFARHTGRFLQFRSRRKVQRLILLGDLIHSEGQEQTDASLQMIQDVMRMQATLGADNVIMLLGNHELAHVYGIVLRKGNYEYTSRFERSLGNSGRRDEILRFLDGLPFYVRTAAGVALTHAGPDGNAIAMFKRLIALDHVAIRDEYTQILLSGDAARWRDLYAAALNENLPYENLARLYLAVNGPDDPRYNDLVRGHLIAEKSNEFSVLWDALFTRCEKQTMMPLYQRVLARFLAMLSEGAPAPQTVLVTGHIDVMGGHQIVTPAHLRIASAKHATPREAGQYLLFDAARPIANVAALTGSLGSVYGPT